MAIGAAQRIGAPGYDGANVGVAGREQTGQATVAVVDKFGVVHQQHGGHNGVGAAAVYHADAQQVEAVLRNTCVQAGADLRHPLPLENRVNEVSHEHALSHRVGS